MKPNPGSKEAYEIGCLCPVLDNGHGNDELGKTRGFWINGQCPIHGQPACTACSDKKEDWEE